ncbi:hypothetical protein AB4027_10505 [Alkalibacterium putridalgicola]|uniref:hypothetical protein n=1 Tax=Alkalibacterium putridalgicola TaxID=426703 RepID=UPI0034CE3707
MFNQKRMIIGATALMLSPVLLPTIVSTQQVYAAENNKTQQQYSENIDDQSLNKITKNDLFIEFENELETINSSDNDISKEQLFDLVTKYEGAEITYSNEGQVSLLRASSGITHSFVQGGVNSYAISGPSIRELARTFQNNANIITTGGILASIPLAFFGTFFTGISTTVLATKFYNAAGIMRQWSATDRYGAGVRITLTSEYPIESRNSVRKATIR